MHETGSNSGLTASLPIKAVPSSLCPSKMDLTSPMSRLRHRLIDCVDEVVAKVGHHATQRICDPRPRRYEHLRQAEFARQRCCVQRPGAAERKQHEVTRIISFRNRNHTHRAGHFEVSEAQYGSGRFDPVQPRRAPDPGRKDMLAPWPRPRDGEPQQALGIEPAEDEVGVGDRRLGTAAPIADRTGIGARALRPDLDQCGCIDARDRAAARSDRCTSTIGTWIGIAYSISISFETAGWALRISATSVEVPPMS